MEQQIFHDDLRPLADLTTAARERLNYLDVQTARRLSRQSILERSSIFGRQDYEPFVSSPLRQPSWDQAAVPTPTPTPSPLPPTTRQDSEPVLDRGFDNEVVVLHPPGLERVSPQVWATWYIQHREGAQTATVPARSASPLQLLSESSEPDYTNTLFPFFSPQQPIGSGVRATGGATRGLPPLGVSCEDAIRTASPSPVESDSSLGSHQSFERLASSGFDIQRPASPKRECGEGDLAWLLQYLPRRGDAG